MPLPRRARHRRAERDRRRGAQREWDRGGAKQRSACSGMTSSGALDSSLREAAQFSPGCRGERARSEPKGQHGESTHHFVECPTLMSMRLVLLGLSFVLCASCTKRGSGSSAASGDPNRAFGTTDSDALRATSLDFVTPIPKVEGRNSLRNEQLDIAPIRMPPCGLL